ncbi:MAG: Z1 domain-containing protein [Tissierellales bacterium]|nr:Z1 domain-containing protein [Tissierellales bacterium]
MGASEASQYIGYTATPYANVFIRPDRVEELFPSDFVVCLERPQHYMGALEFFDIGDCEPILHNSSDIIGNEASHIRVITEKEMNSTGEWDSPPQLDRAIDSFVLAGGIKHWRAKNNRGKFNHHTMLINTDRLTDKHSDTAQEVEGLLRKLYPEKALNHEGNQRLKALWEKDFCKYHSEEILIPNSWSEIEPFINETVLRVVSEGIRIVNCENNEDTPDFDVLGGFWGILIGGSKLSRGYTIEGLTTTYFSRKPGQLDTLVQMARWYGYREGYQDLVRLFIPEFLPRGKVKPSAKKTKSDKRYHLLEAFRFGAMVEESFRKNLTEYSRTLKPENIPPLVQYEFKDFPHKFSYLKPTAQNKKRHANFITTYLGGVARTTTRIGGKGSRLHNANQLIKYFQTCKDGLIDIALNFKSIKGVSAITGISTSKDYLSFIENLEYSDKDKNHQLRVITEQITALKKMDNTAWRVIMYRRQKEPGLVFRLSDYELPNWTRNYEDPIEGTLIYDKPLDPGHKEITSWIAHHREGNRLVPSDQDTKKLRDKNCGITYIVPFSRDKDPNDFFFLWCAFYPGEGSAGVYQVVT